MALFPRKIGGRAMIARHDNESLHLIYSDNLLEWELGTPIMRPQFPWEFIQIGNCGSPSNWMRAGCFSPWCRAGAPLLDRRGAAGQG
jgi:hypothetical protein